jgi:hypothetical protein
MSLDFNTVYRIMVSDEGASKEPYLLAIAVGVRSPKEGILEWIPNSPIWPKYRVQARVTREEGDTVWAVDTQAEEAGNSVTYQFDPLTLALFEEVKDGVVGYEEIVSQITSDSDLQALFFGDLMRDDWVEFVTDVPIVSESFPPPLAVLALGSYDFRRALAEDADGFSILGKDSSLEAAVQEHSSVILAKEDISSEEATLLAQSSYSLVLVSTCEDRAAERFFALAPMVDAFCLYADGDPPRRVWVKGKKGQETIRDSELVEIFREQSGVEWADYLVRAANTTPDPDFDPNAVFTFCQEAIRLSK